MKRFILSSALMVFVAVLCNNAFAYDFSAVCESGQTLYYNITSNTEPYTVEITNEISENFYGDNVNYYNNGNMNSPSGNMLIPTIVTYNNREYTVVSIGEAAFCRCTGLTSVTIPSTIVSIGKGAFCRCNGLVSIVIPNSVTSIGEMVFYYCSGLTSVTLPNSVTIISDLAFFNCGRLASVTIGDFVTSIGLQAFYNCETLASITIPGTVTSIGKYAFYNCRGLASITIPNSVTSVDELAFGGCSGLTSVTIPDSGVRFGAKIFEGCVGLTEPVYNGECFVVFPCGYATEYTIPDGIQQIVGGAFKNCTELADIIIPNSVDSIGQEAFYSCSGLTSITIPNSVTSIGGSAFSGCTGLTEITIPNSVNSIEGSAFRNCTSIQTVNFNATRCIKMGMFSMAVFYGCSSLTTLNIGNNVTYIPEAAFACCSELTGSLTIPNSVDSIGEDAFKYCGLSEIILPYSIHRIEYSTFNYCTNLTSFVIPNSVTYIGGYAFANCNVMTSITIPNTVTYIGEHAFQDCQALATITIPDSVTYIGYCAFQNCIGLTSIIIPNSITSIYQSTFENCQALTLITIPNSVINIDTYAFRGCNSLTSINIPNSVTSIGNYVFSGCSELDSIYSLALVPPTVSQYTFESLSSDLPIIIPCGCYSVYNSAAYWNRFTNMQPYCHSYTLSVISANPDQGTVSGGGTYMSNEIATLTATPNEGYAFLEWNDGNTDNPRTITVTSDSTFVANFTSSSSDIQAKFYIDSNATVEAGSSMTLLATEDFVVYPIIFNAGPDEAADTLTVDLLINGDSMLAGGAQSISLASQPLPVNRPVIIFPDDGALAFSADQMDSYGLFGTIELCFIANYSGNDPNTENNTVCITVTRQQQHTITVLANNEEYGTVTGGGTYDYGTEIQISAIASEHCHFVQWSDGITDNPRTVVVEGDTTYTASFAIDQHTITVLSDDENLGSVSEGGTYNYGTEIQISATASEGYAFLSWNDGNAENPRTIEVISDTTYIATFAIARTVTIESSNTDMGYVIGSGVYAEGAEVEITAVPYEGYRFDHWVDVDNPSRDFNTDNPRTIEVSTDVTYMAVFTDVVGIEDNGVPAISVFPNPTSDIINITSSEPISEIEIVNMMGQLVKRIEVNSDNAVCDVEDLKAGVYVVRIRTLRQAQGAVLRKFIKE